MATLHSHRSRRRHSSTSAPIRSTSASVASAALIAAALVLPAAPAAAQGDYHGPVLLKLPASTRALALGNAFPVNTTDSDAVFYNPAFADRLRGAGAAVQWYDGATSVFSASAGLEWWNGGLGIGVRALDHGLAAIADSLPAGEAALTRAGSTSAERAVTVSYGRRVKGVRLAASGHYVQHRTALGSTSLVVGDVATGMVLGPAGVGLAVRNIGASYDMAGTDITPPLMVTLSAATQARPTGPFDITPAASITYEIDGDVVAGGGLEFGYWPVPGRTFLLRVGARHGVADASPFTAGAGFIGDRIIIDYAIVPYDGGAASHRVGIRWQ